eukprot:5894053-Amphidinium_carterae.5
MLSFKADVMAVKSQLGRTSGGTLTMVCTHLEAVEYWKELLFRYMRDIPNMQAHIPVMMEHMARLQDLACTLPGCKILHESVKELHQFKAALKGSHVQPLEQRLKGVALDFHSTILALGDDPENQHNMATIIQPTLHELSILCPDDSTLYEAVNTMGKYMTSIKTASIHKQATHLCDELVAALSKNPEDVQRATTALASLSKLVNENSCSQSTMSEEKMQKLERAWEKMLPFMASQQFIDEPTLPEEVIKQLVQCICTLPSFGGFGVADSRAIAAAFEAAYVCDQKFRAYKPDSSMTKVDMIAKDSQKSQLKGLKRALSAVASTEQKLKAASVPLANDVWSAWA